MGKIITASNGYKYKIVSEWKPIRYMNITHNHRLWDFGEETENEKYRTIAYFDFHNKKYTLSQFMRIDGEPIYFTDRAGYTQVISGADCLGGLHPLLLQVNDGGDYIRLFEAANDV